MRYRNFKYYCELITQVSKQHLNELLIQICCLSVREEVLIEGEGLVQLTSLTILDQLLWIMETLYSFVHNNLAKLGVQLY
jgi:hypothetical protein